MAQEPADVKQALDLKKASEKTLKKTLSQAIPPSLELPNTRSPDSSSEEQIFRSLSRPSTPFPIPGLDPLVYAQGHSASQLSSLQQNEIIAPASNVPQVSGAVSYSHQQASHPHHHMPTESSIISPLSSGKVTGRKGIISPLPRFLPSSSQFKSAFSAWPAPKKIVPLVFQKRGTKRKATKTPEEDYDDLFSERPASFNNDYDEQFVKDNTSKLDYAQPRDEIDLHSESDPKPMALEETADIQEKITAPEIEKSSNKDRVKGNSKAMDTDKDQDGKPTISRPSQSKRAKH